MAKKKLYDEHGNVVKGAEIKKPFYKKVWFWALVLVIFAMAVSGGEEATEEPKKDEPVTAVTKTDTSSKETEETEDEVDSSDPETDTTEDPVEEEPEEEPVSREFKNAMKAANDYLNYTSFSKKGLFDQLVFENYPEDAAQYAVDNIDADWNANALQAAIDYLDYTSFSDQGLRDQLVFEGYTEEQASYAIENLPE